MRFDQLAVIVLWSKIVIQGFDTYEYSAHLAFYLSPGCLNDFNRIYSIVYRLNNINIQ